MQTGRKAIAPQASMFRDNGLFIAFSLLSGFLALFFFIAPSQATPIWPPAGLALAAMLTDGRRLRPGLLLAALMLGSVVGFARYLHEGWSVVLAMGGATALSLLVEAALAVLLLRRFGRYPNNLEQPSQVLRFFILAGVAALCGTGLRTAAAVLLTPTHPVSLLFDSLVWWTGDSLGITVFTPLALAWRHRQAAAWATRRPAITLCLATTCAASLLLIAYTTDHQRRTYEQELTELANAMSAGLEKNFSLYVDAIASLEGLYGSVQDVDPETFQRFSASVATRLPNITALVWISHIDGSERGAFESRTGTSIRELGPDRQWATAGRHDEYFPVTAVYPEASNRVALSFDLRSEPVRRQAIDEARTTGRLVITPLVPLVTGSSGVLAFIPVYPDNGLRSGPSSAIKGFAMGVFRPAGLAEDAFSRRAMLGATYWLVDVTDPRQPVVLASNGEASPRPFQMFSNEIFGIGSLLEASRQIEAGGRIWSVNISPGWEFILSFQQEFAWLVLLSALIVNGLTGAAVLVVTGRETTLRRTADERALALSEIATLHDRVREEVESRFNIIMGNVGEAILVIDGNGYIEAFNRAAEDLFGHQAAEVIGCDITLLMPPDDANRCQAEMPHILKRQASRLAGRSREVVAKKSDGSLFHAELSLGEAGSADHPRFIAIVRDISQRKEAERTLRESEERFRDIAGSGSDWFWETDDRYNLTFVSERIGAILGVKAQAVQGLSHFDLGLDELPELAATHRADIEARRPFRDLIFHVGPTGNAKDSKSVRLSGMPIFDRDGQFVGYRGVGADITRELDAERRAQLAVQQMADAIESVPDAIAVFDENDRLVVCNAEYKKVYGSADFALNEGRSFEEILIRCTENGLYDMQGRPPADWMAMRLANHRLASGEATLIHMTDGRWIQNREFRTTAGGSIVLRSDITELKCREEELENLRRRYALILDSAGEGIIGISALGAITFANRTAGNLLGYPPEKIIGRALDDLLGGLRENSPDSLRPVAEVAFGQTDNLMKTGTDVFRTSGGRSLTVDYQLAPKVENGKTIGAVMVFRDASLRLQYERSLADHQKELEREVAERTADLRREVAIRAQVEAALRASRERHKRVTDNMFEGVLGFDRSGHLVFANPSARRLLNCEDVEGDIEGYPLDAVFRLRQDGREIDFAASPWKKAIADNLVYQEDDATFVTASGRAVSVAYACSPLPFEDGRHAAILSFRDIETLKAAQREAIQASRLASVGQLAAGIAHEINTPIQYIGDNLRYIGKSTSKLSEFLANAGEITANGAVLTKLPAMAGDIDDAVRESLDGVAQIARIVLSMKEFSHPGTSNKTTTNINKALESTLTVTRNEWKHSAEIERQLDPNLPAVLCHAGEMNQVFLNLIINATHAIEASGKPKPGKITIVTQATEQAVVIRIADSGTGVPETIREKIFDPFFTTKEVGKGTGQGLAICRDVVVTKHGGSIDVVSRPGEGAEFIVTLPLGHPDSDLQEEA